jgi:hypothetical protein
MRSGGADGQAETAKKKWIFTAPITMTSSLRMATSPGSMSPSGRTPAPKARDADRHLPLRVCKEKRQIYPMTSPKRAFMAIRLLRIEAAPAARAGSDSIPIAIDTPCPARSGRFHFPAAPAAPRWTCR